MRTDQNSGPGQTAIDYDTSIDSESDSLWQQGHQPRSSNRFATTESFTRTDVTNAQRLTLILSLREPTAHPDLHQRRLFINKASTRLRSRKQLLGLSEDLSPPGDPCSCLGFGEDGICERSSEAGHRVTLWELSCNGRPCYASLGDRSAYDKKTSTSEWKERLDGPFEPPREDPSRSANSQES